MNMLSATWGSEFQDPAFWIPLVCYGLLVLILFAMISFDGFDLGVSCLCLSAPAFLRTRMLTLLTPWRDINACWLPLGFALFLTAFPHAVRPLLETLMLPLSLLAVGTLLRDVAFAFHLRAPLVWQPRLQYGVAIGAWMVVAAHGWLLALFVMPFDPFVGRHSFTAFTILGTIMAYCLLGATWLMLHEPAALYRYAARCARRCLRWAVATAISICTALALGNPTVFILWVGDTPWQGMALLWLGMFVSVVVLDRVFKHYRLRQTRALPFRLSLFIFLMMFAGILYSVFPDIILNEMTLWHSAASQASLQVVLYAWLIALPFILGASLWMYRDVFARDRATPTRG